MHWLGDVVAEEEKTKRENGMLLFSPVARQLRRDQQHGSSCGSFSQSLSSCTGKNSSNERIVLASGVLLRYSRQDQL